jgi:hypothetical protein
MYTNTIKRHGRKDGVRSRSAEYGVLSAESVKKLFIFPYYAFH